MTRANLHYRLLYTRIFFVSFRGRGGGGGEVGGVGGGGGFPPTPVLLWLLAYSSIAMAVW